MHDQRNQLPHAAPANAGSHPSEQSSVKKFLQTLGPGLITGASDDDPSGIVTYSMAGAAFGYATLWTALITFPLMAGVQFICAKIGLVHGCGLAEVMRKSFPRKLVYPAIASLIIANTINAAADIQAIAAGINLLIPIPIVVLILPIALGILVVQIWGSYKTIVKIFRWLALSLLAYIVAAFLAGPNWSEVLHGTVVPTIRFDSEFLSMLVAILGTTISPYLFFWQSNHEVEEKASKPGEGDPRQGHATSSELKYAAWDVNAGMLLSNVVMYFIILSAAATLHQSDTHEIETATQAAEALKPVAGQAAFLLMALGLIGTGVLAVPILTGSTAYAVAEAMGWESGLDKKPGRAKEFYLVIACCTIGALLINYLGVNPMKALFITSVINGFLAPPILVGLMIVSNDPKIMGKRVNGVLLNILGWSTTALTSIAAVVLVWTWTQ
jgi:NRAMP (natural resistance-associated macrophage protein)-like metal ion transporter